MDTQKPIVGRVFWESVWRIVILAFNHDILEIKEQGFLSFTPVNIGLYIIRNFGIELEHTWKSKDKRQHLGKRRCTMYSKVFGLHALQSSPGSLWS